MITLHYYKCSFQKTLEQEIRGESNILNAGTIIDLSNRCGGGDVVSNKGRKKITAIATNEKYKDTKERLRGLLTEEKRNLQAVRASYTAEIKSRTELEMLLRQCVDDVRKEISLVSPRLDHNTVASSHVPLTTAALQISISCFQKCDRERTLELLLSQERVIHLLSTNILQRSTVGNECAVIDSNHGHTSHDTAKTDILISAGVPESNSVIKSDKGDFDDEEISAFGPLIAPEMAATTNTVLSCAVSDSTGTRLPAI